MRVSGAKAVSFENRDYYIELGFNIAYYRKRAGMTQDELAERIGISRSHLSAIEAPNIIRPFSLEIIRSAKRQKMAGKHQPSGYGSVKAGRKTAGGCGQAGNAHAQALRRVWRQYV